MMANAPMERTVAWRNGGISGSASLTETWFSPHESVRPTMINAATASSGRAVEGITIGSLRHGRACPGQPRLARGTKDVDARHKPGMTESFAMPAHAGDLDHAGFRRKARALCRRVEALGDRRGRRLADRAALLADEEHHRRVARMVVDAGEERVAALDAMHQHLRGEKVERAVERVRPGPGPVASAEKVAYVAAKHGIIGLTKVVALETANDGITCNAISPGWVLTPLVQKQIEDRAKAQGKTVEQASNELLSEKQPMLKFSTPENIGALALFLASDAAESITGSSYSIDGGWTAQ